MTFEEFFEFEQESPLRHEFVNGAIFAMSDSSLNHCRIRQNLMFAIHAHLKRTPCEVFFLGLKLVIRRETNTIVYCPDLIVDCCPDTRDTYYLRDPRLIAEVLSPSTTQLIDRREKLMNYRLLDSLEEYILVSQDEHRVVVYPRAERWKPRTYAGLDTAVELRSIDLTVPLIELYGDVTLP